MQLAALARVPLRQASSNAAGTQRHDSKAIRVRITPHAPVAQWIEQPPPKGQVARSIRVWGAKRPHRYAASGCFEGCAWMNASSSMHASWIRITVGYGLTSHLYSSALTTCGTRQQSAIVT